MKNPVLFGPRPQYDTLGDAVSRTAGLHASPRCRDRKVRTRDVFLQRRPRRSAAKVKIACSSPRTVRLRPTTSRRKCVRVRSRPPSSKTSAIETRTISSSSITRTPTWSAIPAFMDATISSVETLDVTLGRLEQAVLDADGIMAITADHGNAEEKLDRQGQPPHGAHDEPRAVRARRASGRKLGDARKRKTRRHRADALAPARHLAVPGAMDGTNSAKATDGTPAKLAISSRRPRSRGSRASSAATVRSTSRQPSCSEAVSSTVVPDAYRRRRRSLTKKLGAPQHVTFAGHPGSGLPPARGRAKRVVAFAGRAHLYQGHTASRCRRIFVKSRGGCRCANHRADERRGRAQPRVSNGETSCSCAITST